MLELKNISFAAQSDGKRREILHNINMKLTDGKLTVVTGPNGGGKSTLAKVIAGIITPTSGQIFFDGEDITSLGITERAKKGVAFAFQQPVRFKGIRVLDLLRIAAGKHLSVSEACEYLSEVGLCAREYIDREVNASLSGGELKRVEIATVLARGAALSVFDEPEAGIDLWSFQNLIRVFENIKRGTRGAVMIISHQERILNIADEIVVLKDGEIVRSGGKDEILPTIIGTESAVSECAALNCKGAAEND